MSFKELKKIKPKTNTIYRGDNLELMRAMPDSCVDLIYIDPPFFTQRDYKNIWGDKESVQDYEDDFFEGFRDTKDFFEKHISSDAKGLKAYLEWMRARLVELHRILKPTGSIYVHLDDHAVHYIKVMLDEIFGYENFRNEIIWKRLTNNKAQTNQNMSRMHDIILFYTKSKKEFTLNRVYLKSDAEKDQKNYSHIEAKTGRSYGTFDFTQAGDGPARRFGNKLLHPPKGKHWIWSQEKINEGMKEDRIVFSANGTPRVKRYLDEKKGNLLGDIWNDDGVLPIQAHSKEKTGWPTQKPVALLERIIAISSNEGDVVFDCFAGCGTTIHASHNLKRKWIGIDISPTAIKVNRKRLEEIGAKVEIIDENDLPVELGSDSKRKKNSKVA